jgi:hypothetical protein
MIREFVVAKDRLVAGKSAKIAEKAMFYGKT